MTYQKRKMSKKRHLRNKTYKGGYEDSNQNGILSSISGVAGNAISGITNATGEALGTAKNVIVSAGNETLGIASNVKDRAMSAVNSTSSSNGECTPSWYNLYKCPSSTQSNYSGGLRRKRTTQHKRYKGGKKSACSRGGRKTKKRSRRGGTPLFLQPFADPNGNELPAYIPHAQLKGGAVQPYSSCVFKPVNPASFDPNGNSYMVAGRRRRKH